MHPVAKASLFAGLLASLPAAAFNFNINDPPTITRANQYAFVVGGGCSERGQPIVTTLAGGGIRNSQTVPCGPSTFSWTATFDAHAFPDGWLDVEGTLNMPDGQPYFTRVLVTKTANTALTIRPLPPAINNANMASIAIGGDCDASGGPLTIGSYTSTGGGVSQGPSKPGYCSVGSYATVLDMTGQPDGEWTFFVSQPGNSDGPANTTAGPLTKASIDATLTADPGPTLDGFSVRQAYVTGSCTNYGGAINIISAGTQTGSGSCGLDGRYAAWLSALTLPMGEIPLLVTIDSGPGHLASASTTARKVFAAGPDWNATRRGVDFDGDGRADLTLQDAAGLNAVWEMDGLRIAAGARVNGGAGAVRHAMGDFNGDGRTDILWRMPDASYWITLSSGLGMGAPVQVMGPQPDPTTRWEVLGLGDFNGDGKADLLWMSPSVASGAWLMNGTTVAGYGTINDPTLSNATIWSIRMLGDFDGDGRTDILWTNGPSTMITTLSNFALAQVATYQTGTWIPRALVDTNGDRRSDIVWRNVDGSYGLWIMNGVNATSYGALFGAGTGWELAATGDLDGDGRDDLVWQHADGSIAVWLMAGATGKAYGILLGPGNGWKVAALRDLDGDGKKDIVLTMPDGTTAAWLMDGLSIKAGAILLNPGTGWMLAP